MKIPCRCAYQRAQRFAVWLPSPHALGANATATTGAAKPPVRGAAPRTAYRELQETNMIALASR